MTLGKITRIFKDNNIEASEEQINGVLFSINQSFLKDDDKPIILDTFDAACEEVDTEYTGETTQENAIEFIKNSDTATVTFSQGRYVSKMKKLAEKHPDEVKIVAENEDGSIVAHIPTRYIHISNSKREITEEQRNAAAERLRNYHNSKEV